MEKTWAFRTSSNLYYLVASQWWQAMGWCSNHLIMTAGGLQDVWYGIMYRVALTSWLLW